MPLRMLRAMRELHVPREVQREKLGHNLFDELEAAFDGNGKAPESEPLMIEGTVLEAEPDDGDGNDSDDWDND